MRFVLGDIHYSKSVLHIQGLAVINGCKIVSYSLMVNVLQSKVSEHKESFCMSV